MRHKVKLTNAGAEKTYEVILETAGVKWQAIWRTVDKDGVPVRGPHGSTVDANGITLLERVKTMLVAEGAPVADQEWVYEPPLPPWKDPAAG